MITLQLAAVAVALTVCLGGNAAAVKDSFDLKGEVYVTHKIEMTTVAGQRLTRIKAGTYRIKVEDKASIHDFHLTGPGVNKATSVSGVLETIWTVRLKPGTYTYACDVHSDMHGSFRVTA
jgi:plastocyanin